jgi:hypothetical protein
MRFAVGGLSVVLSLAAVVVIQMRVAGQAGSVVAAETVSDRDTYAIYAVVLPSRRDPPGATVSLSQETHGGSSCELQGDEPHNIPPEWRPALSNYMSANATQRLIAPGRDLGVAYSLVPAAELKKRMEDAGEDLSKWHGDNAPGAKVFARFPGGRLMALSAVGFNADRTRAIVTIQQDCFPLIGAENSPCQEGRTVLLRKENGRWIETRGGCVWVS